MKEPILALAPAKINPFLRILGRRPDGFHNIQTLLVGIDLCDELEFAPHDSLSLSCEGNPAVPEDDTNLVLKAAMLLKSESRCRSGARIRHG